MNILICSAGRRVKLIQYFKEELDKINGKVLAVDCDGSAPALYQADFYEIVPRVDNPNYIQHIKYLCRKYHIKAVLSLIDPELSILASAREEFVKDNIIVIIPEKNIVDICFDKYLTYQVLHEHGFPTIPTYIDINHVLRDIANGKLQFPLIVKPRKGSASIGIAIMFAINELKRYVENNIDIVIQPFIKGEEYGVDCYIDLLSKETINIFMKKKIKMRAGETDKSIAIKDEKLKVLIEDLLNMLKPVGPIDVDCFRTEDGFVVSEINPRFGGGYPHAHESGQNFIRYIINNVTGIANQKELREYSEGTTMVKYDQVILLPASSCIKKEAESGLR